MEENKPQADKFDLLKLLLNLKEEKKKPYNITIKNNRNEPKVKENVRYSAKQNYRIYKSKIEPKLHNKIKIDEEDDIVSAIRQEFEKRNRNKPVQEVPVFENPYIKPPETSEKTEAKNKALDFLADKYSKKALDEAMAEFEGEDLSFLDDLDAWGQETQADNQRPLDISEIDDIDRETILSIQNQINDLEPFTPEVKMRGVDMSKIESLRKQIEREKLNSSKKLLLLTDDNFTATKLQNAYRSRLARKQVKDKKELLKGLSSSISETSEATTLLSTPAAGRGRGRPPLKKLEGRTLEI